MTFDEFMTEEVAKWKRGKPVTMDTVETALRWAYERGRSDTLESEIGKAVRRIGGERL
jgi:hypothetical protein